MATYNGEKYLRNQLLSLQQQTFKNWTLWVRDDGSVDNTVKIVDEFVKADARIRKVTENSGQGLGPGRNFLGLSKYASSDYVMFCDQDDIWFEKKIELLVNLAKVKLDTSLPGIVYCDAYGYSDNEGSITLGGVSQLYANSLQEFLFFNAGYQGCSILFNHTLLNFIKTYRAEYIYMHDDVVSLIAHVFGQVVFLPKSLMLYRQHASNVTGNINDSFSEKIRRIFKAKSFVLSGRHYQEKKSFFEAYQSEISLQNKKLFSAYISYPEKSLIGRLWLIFHNRFSMGGNMLKLLTKTLLRRPIE